MLVFKYKGFYGKFCETSLLAVATLPTTRVTQSTTTVTVLSTMNDPCKVNLCQNGATCQSLGFSDYICICQTDFEGKLCESSKRSVTQTVQVNLCDSNSCLNGGVCSVKEDGSINCACARKKRNSFVYLRVDLDYSDWICFFFSNYINW